MILINLPFIPTRFFSYLYIFIFVLLASVEPSQATELSEIKSSSIQSVFVFPSEEQKGFRLDYIVLSGESDNPYEEGLAHYLEHLVWSRLKFSDSIQSNATTTLFITGYQASGNISDLHEAIQLMEGIFTPISVQADFALSELGIIAKEFQSRFPTTENFLSHEKFRHQLYGSSNLSRSVIVPPSRESNYNLARAQQLHENTHSAENTVAIFYGNISQDDIRRFYPEAELNVVRDANFKDLNFLGDKETLTETNFNLVLKEQRLIRIGMVVPIPREYLELGSQHLRLLAELIDKWLNSRLEGSMAAELFEKRLVAQSTQASLIILGHNLLSFVVSASPAHDVTNAQLKAELIAYLHGLVVEGIPPLVFNRMKLRYENSLKSLGDPELFAHKQSLENLAMGGRPVLFNEIRAAAGAVTAAQASRLLILMHNSTIHIQNVQTNVRG